VRWEAILLSQDLHIYFDPTNCMFPWWQRWRIQLRDVTNFPVYYKLLKFVLVAELFDIKW